MTKIKGEAKRNKRKFMHEILNNNAPAYLNNLLPKPAENNPYNLRNSHEQ